MVAILNLESYAKWSVNKGKGNYSGDNQTMSLCLSLVQWSIILYNPKSNQATTQTWRKKTQSHMRNKSWSIE